MADAGQILRELTRALCVLAVIFLNFGHAQATPVGYTADLTPYVLSDQALAQYCQQTGQDNPQAHHTPCHACRIGGSADLPPPPDMGMPAFFAVEQIAYGAVATPFLAVKLPKIRGARAPPLA